MVNIVIWIHPSLSHSLIEHVVIVVKKMMMEKGSNCNYLFSINTKNKEISTFLQ